MKLGNLFWVILPLLAASCSDDDDESSGRTPISFSTDIEAVSESRLTVNDSWAGQGDSEVGVQIGDEIKVYTADEDGTLTSSDPFYWEDYTGTVTASAYYPYVEGGKPSSVTVSADQSVPANYLASDLMETADTEVTSTNATLTFTHRTNKVECSLAIADGEDESTNGATVTLLNLTGVDSGTSVITSGDYCALVAPQTLPAGTDFLEVELEDGKSYIYTLESDLTLEAGYVTPIDIEVAVDKMEVTIGDSYTWTGNSEDVTSDSPGVGPDTDNDEWTSDGSDSIGSDSPEVGTDADSNSEWGSDGVEIIEADTAG